MEFITDQIRQQRKKDQDKHGRQDKPALSPSKSSDHRGNKSGKKRSLKGYPNSRSRAVPRYCFSSRAIMVWEAIASPPCPKLRRRKTRQDHPALAPPRASGSPMPAGICHEDKRSVFTIKTETEIRQKKAEVMVPVKARDRGRTQTKFFPHRRNKERYQMLAGALKTSQEPQKQGDALFLYEGPHDLNFGKMIHRAASFPRPGEVRMALLMNLFARMGRSPLANSAATQAE